MLSDADIRPALKTELAAVHGKQPDTIFLEELGIKRGEVRVDVAVVNGDFHGYEIKSDRDSLRRLAVQAELYGDVLDQATLVTSDRHIEESMQMLPKWWGILHVMPTSKELQFKTVRRARKNPARSARVLVEFLWYDDAIALLEQHGLDRGVRSKPRQIIWDRICENLSIEVIASAVRAQLKSREARLTAPSQLLCGE